jgi:hypothetical protein
MSSGQQGAAADPDRPPLFFARRHANPLPSRKFGNAISHGPGLLCEGPHIVRTELQPWSLLVQMQHLYGLTCGPFHSDSENSLSSVFALARKLARIIPKQSPLDLSFPSIKPAVSIVFSTTGNWLLHGFPSSLGAARPPRLNSFLGTSLALCTQTHKHCRVAMHALSDT